MKPRIHDLDAFRRPRAEVDFDVPPLVELISLDPGGTTGWNLMRLHPEALLPEGPSVLKSIKEWQIGQVDCGSTKGNLGISPYAGISTTGECAGAATLGKFIRAWPGAAVVVESFYLREFSKDQDLLSPQRITAKIEQYLWSDRRDYFTQQPAEAKATATDERLKLWGFYTSEGGMVHARDATRHALTFLKKASQANPKAAALRAAAWPWFYGSGEKYGPSRLRVGETA